MTATGAHRSADTSYLPIYVVVSRRGLELLKKYTERPRQETETPKKQLSERKIQKMINMKVWK